MQAERRQVQEEKVGGRVVALLYSADDGMWIACAGCQNWFNLSCTNIRNSRKLPDVFYCENCVS